MRWQPQATTETDPPTVDPPEGWQPAEGRDGIWTPVALSSHAILWRRLLVPVKVKQEALDLDSEGKAVPQWARKAAGRGVGAGELCDTVIDILGQITGREPKPSRSASAAGEVLKVWRKLERPPLVEFRDDFALVARAARECPDPLFGRDIRAEGWSEGRDRSHDVSTLCVLKKWDDRLRVARQWADGPTDRPVVPDGFGDDSKLPSMF